MARVDMSRTAARDLVARPSSDAWAAGVGQEMAAAMRAEAPVDTGALAGSSWEVHTDLNGAAKARAGSLVKYGEWVHEGTGLYGPLARRITPTVAKALTWIDARTGDRVFARSTKGQKPNPWILRALRGLGFRRIDSHSRL